MAEEARAGRAGSADTTRMSAYMEAVPSGSQKEQGEECGMCQKD